MPGKAPKDSLDDLLNDISDDESNEYLPDASDEDSDDEMDEVSISRDSDDGSERSNPDKHIKHLTAAQRNSRFAHSALRIDVNGMDPSYEYPHGNHDTTSWHGSGFVIHYKGKNLILSNAHVADHPTSMFISLPGNDTQFEATVINVDPDCDCALLDVKDEKFWNQVKPLELDDMVKLEQTISVVGFPMGGENLSITRGTVSRIEVQDYCHAGTINLQVQVDAPINPGNSGGMVVSNNKVVGIAFQGMGGVDGGGFMIPTPVIKHFVDDSLKAIETNEMYGGFPALAIKVEELKNETVRRHYGLSNDMGGMRVRKVDRLSAAYEKLKPNDVILEIDGKPIKRDCTIDTEFGGGIDWEYTISPHNIGDTIKIKFMRDKVMHEADITLTNRAGTTEKVPLEFNKLPSYYIESGLVFATLTHNEDCAQIEEYDHAQKKHPGQEVVVLNAIIDNHKTHHYGKQQRETVRHVNGEKIRNLRDLKAAFEKCKPGDDIVIDFAKDQNNQIVINKMSVKEREAFLKKHRIISHQSQDLEYEPMYPPGCPEFTHFPEFRMTRDKLTARAHEKEKRLEAEVAKLGEMRSEYISTTMQVVAKTDTKSTTAKDEKPKDKERAKPKPKAKAASAKSKAQGAKARGTAKHARSSSFDEDDQPIVRKRARK